MVATVESAFVLIDRASGPAKGIRRELRGVRRDAEQAGRAIDDMAGPKAAKRLEQTAKGFRRIRSEAHGAERGIDRSTAAVDRLKKRDLPKHLEQGADGFAELGKQARGTATDVDATSRSVVRYGRDVNRAERHVQALGHRTSRARQETIGLGRAVVGLGFALKALKIPAAIAAVGGLVQVVGALSMGVVALIPQLGEASGLAAGAIPVFAGLGASMITVKLATSDLGKALGGNKKALEGLTPEARAFMQVIKEMNPEVERLRRTAQRNLFPGLASGLEEARSAIPTADRIMAQTGKDVGGLGRFLGRQLSANTQQGRAWLADMVKLSDIGSRSLGALARSGVYLARALTSVGVAAGPLTDWMGNGIERWAKATAVQAKTAEETGRLGRYFDRARDSGQRLWRVVSNTFGGLRGLLRAASGQSRDLYDSMGDVTERFDEWANSVNGQTSMRRWFDDMRPGLTATVGLFGDLGAAIGELSRGPEAARMIESLRDALPDMVSGIRSLTSALGPAVVDAFGQVVKLLGDLAGEAGPLTLVARSVGQVASALDVLLNATGPVGPAIATAVGAFLLLRKMGVLGILERVRLKWLGITAATTQASAAAAGYGVAPAAAVARGGATPVMMGPAGNPGMARNAAAGGMGAGQAAIIAGGGGLVASNAMRGTTFGRQYQIGRAAGAGRLASARGAIGDLRALRAPTTATVGTLAKGAGRIAWPIALTMGAFGALGTEGSAAQRAQGGFSAATMGIIPKPITANQKEEAGAAHAGQIIDRLSTGDDRKDNSFAGQRAAIDTLEHQLSGFGLKGSDSFDQNKKDLKTATDYLDKELKRRRQLLRENERAQRDILASSSVQKAEALTKDFTDAFGIRSKKDGPEKAMDRLNGGLIRKMRQMNPAGRKVLAENTLAWAREQARNNPALLDEVEKLERRIKRSFRRTGRDVQIVNGEILTGSRREWRSIRTALTTQTEKARQEVSEDFTAMQRAAVGSLTSMGFSPSDARKLVRNIEAGGKRGKQSAAIAASGTAGSGGRHESVDTRLKSATGDGIGHDRIGDGTGGKGSAGGGGSPGLMGAKAGLSVYAQDAAGFGLRVSSGGRPGAITNAGNTSYHASGDALDLAGSPDAMMRFAKHAASAYGSRLEELIYSPMGFSIKNGQRVAPYAVADHFDHVHIADTSPGGAGGGAMGGLFGGGGLGGSVSIESNGSSVGGLPGAIGTAAGAMYAAGLEKKLNDAIGSIGGDMPGMTPGGAVPGGATSAGGTYDKAALAALWSQANPGLGDPNLMAAIALAESSGNPGAIGIPTSGGRARGLWQIMWPLHASKFPGMNPLNPMDNARMAGSILQSQGIGAWEAYTRGMHTKFMGDGWGAPGGPAVQWGGWNAKGADVTVNRPTLFGAGEAGAERVQITPKGKTPAGGGGAGRIVLAPHIAVTVDGKPSESLRRWVDQRFREFAEQIAEEIETGVDDDVELMA